MTKIHKLIAKFHAPSKFFVSGALIVAMFQIPVLPDVSKLNVPIKSASVTAGSISQLYQEDLTGTFFGEEAVTDKTQESVRDQIEFVSSRKAFPASLAVIQKHENTIKSKARENNVPEDVAIGVGLLENGGSETAKSPAGALGVFQLMPGTARSLGLTVNKTVDDRRDPEKNIEAGMKYLSSNYERFGDWGLATWAYHAGEGNVSKALKLYAKANHGVNLKGLKDTKALRDYVEEHGITIHKLLSDPAVKTLTNKLNDDSAGYPYKVIATAKLFREKGARASAR